MTVREIKRKINLTEFFDWLAFLEWEEIKTTLTHQYLAQIAQMVMASQGVKNTRREDFLLKTFSEMDLERVKQSKQKWMGAVGYDGGESTRQAKREKRTADSKKAWMRAAGATAKRK